jgi:hypothetical protein
MKEIVDRLDFIKTKNLCCGGHCEENEKTNHGLEESI